ncbi:MAG: glycoside hydrolase family 88 protein [Opitutaceae bacterium]|nr:glycoside hydrolase family 88 protein [Opitutaceae bacterium]
MGFYFENHASMYARAGMQVEKTLETVVRRFIGQNPAHPPTYRAFNRHGILRGKDYRYAADFSRLYPDARLGQFVYAWAKIWSETESSIRFDVNCHSPLLIWRNGEQIFRSDIFQERYFKERAELNIALRAGWNHLVIRFKKTRGGFGAVFGTWLGKLPYYFVMPVPEREGQEGWLHTEPLDRDLASIPTEGTNLAATGVRWLPSLEWPAAQAKMGNFQRMFGTPAGACAVGWTRALFTQADGGTYTLSGSARAPLEIVVADKVVHSVAAAGPFSARVTVPFGLHDVMVRATCAGSDWGFELKIADPAGGALAFSSPCRIAGSSETWIHLGPIAPATAADLAALRDLNKLAPGAAGADVYWRLDLPDTWVRPYNDNALYGKWNYPLGVTLYGVLHAAKAVGSEDAQRYVANHLQFCCDTFRYAHWDKEQYGGATNVHHLLTSLDSLDDCGSAGSALLEVAKYFDLRGFRVIADIVADHISTKQIRLSDGTFFRKNLMHSFHEDTLWADDLYMSVPFLCRYYQLTGDAKYIDDAARQFLGFKRLLFLPDLKLMAHVYDFMRDMNTGIPWGRGNGWVVFSLSELLAVLPKDHALRPALLSMFRELCEGLLAQQDADGMWHQVINEHDSYIETSCTSMFAYAFARGVQQGLFAQPEPYVAAVFRAWSALNRNSIDHLGNVHGVCRGSEFSFQSEYYKKDLLWNLNDTHGIGIVLLAGVEVLKLTKFLQGAKA